MYLSSVYCISYVCFYDVNTIKISANVRLTALTVDHVSHKAVSLRYVFNLLTLWCVSFRPAWIAPTSALCSSPTSRCPTRAPTCVLVATALAQIALPLKSLCTKVRIGSGFICELVQKTQCCEFVICLCFISFVTKFLG